MINWESVLITMVILGYLIALTVSLVRWQGFKVAVRKHSNTLVVMILLTILFMAVGGAKALYVVIIFAFALALVFTLIAGPMGFVLGLYLGFFLGIYFMLYSIFA